MKKKSVWVGIAVFSFFIGVSSVIYLSFLPIHVKPPGEICLSDKFPGKSISINELNIKTRSAGNISVSTGNVFVFSEESDDLFKAFEEEIFEAEKFQDGKAFPEIAMANEIYRFFWLRTFHNPVMIRLYRIADEKYIVTKQTDGRGGYNKGKLIFNETRKLRDSEWCEFIKLLDEAEFWNKKKIESLINDGAEWTIEGIRDQRYYISGEQSPQTGKFRDACIYLMRISGLKIDENSKEFY